MKLRTVFIAYDLRGPRRDYRRLYDAIKGYPHWHHCQHSGWLVAGEGITAKSVAAHLSALVTNESSVMCLDVVGSSVRGSLDPDDWDWIYRFAS